MKKEKNVLQFFLNFYRRFSIPWWLYLVTFGVGIVYAEAGMRVSQYLVRVNKGELYNSVILSYVFMMLFNALLGFLRPLVMAYADQRVILRVRSALWRKILHLPMEVFEKEQPSSLVSAVTNDVTQATMVIGGVFSGAVSLFGFARACMILYQYNAPLSVYLLLCIPVAVAVFILVGKLQYTIMKKRYASLNQMTTFFSEHLSAGKYVKAQVMEEKELESGFAAIDSRYRADVYYAFMSQIQTLAHSIYSLLTTIVMAVGGSRLIRAGKMEATGINMFSTYMTQVNMYLAELLTVWQNVMGSKGALTHVSEILDLDEEDAQKGKAWIESQNQDIVFKNVNFGYQDGTEILHDFSVRIPGGKMTAVVGDNGSGKSTIMKLMQGFYQPDSGEIRVGENLIGETKLQDVHKRFGYVLQSNPLLSGTIRDNILYGTDRPVSEEKLRKAAEEARVDSFVESLPNGYDTMLGEAGNRLSGEQRQRLAIARTLIMQPDYLILDEAGASLDHDTYMKIYHGIRQKMKGHTVVFIAHDMREIAEADYLIVMHHGRLEACGTHEELQKTSRTYQEYLQSQKVS